MKRYKVRLPEQLFNACSFGPVFSLKNFVAYNVIIQYPHPEAVRHSCHCPANPSCAHDAYGGAVQVASQEQHWLPALIPALPREPVCLNNAL